MAKELTVKNVKGYEIGAVSTTIISGSVNFSGAFQAQLVPQYLKHLKHQNYNLIITTVFVITWRPKEYNEKIHDIGEYSKFLNLSKIAKLSQTPHTGMNAEVKSCFELRNFQIKRMIFQKPKKFGEIFDKLFQFWKAEASKPKFRLILVMNS